MLTSADRQPVHWGRVVCGAGITLTLGILAGLRPPPSARPAETPVAQDHPARAPETSYSFPDPGSSTPAEMRRSLETCDPLDRTRRLLGWLDRTEISGFPVIYEELGRSFITDARTEASRLLVDVWMSRDPLGCLAYLDTPRASLGNRPSYENFEQRALGGWSMRSPQDAAAWLAARIGKNPGDWFHPGALKGLIETDLPATLAFFNNHPQISSSQELEAVKLMPLGFDGCVTWISRLRNDQLRHEMEASAADGLIHSDAPKVASWAATLPDESNRNTITRRIAVTWISEDFEAASEWVATLPPGLQKETLQAIATDYSNLDGKTAAWLLSHDDPATDELRNTCMENSDWTQKAGLVQSISDPARRTAGLADLVTEWSEDDCHEARKWIQAHPGAVGPEIEAKVNQAVADLEKDSAPDENKDSAEDSEEDSSGEDRPEADE